MIGRLTGRLASKATDHVLLDVGGVGYLVHIPLSTFYDLPEAESPASLFVHTHVREDTLALYGFLTERERGLFQMLMSVAGIGPKVALTVLSGMPPSELISALSKQDVRRLVAIPGVGKKTAELLVLKMKDRLPESIEPERVALPARSQAEGEATGALIALGYKPGEVIKMLKDLDGVKLTTEEMIREALRRVHRVAER